MIRRTLMPYPTFLASMGLIRPWPQAQMTGLATQSLGPLEYIRKLFTRALDYHLIPSYSGFWPTPVLALLNSSPMAESSSSVSWFSVGNTALSPVFPFSDICLNLLTHPTTRVGSRSSTGPWPVESLYRVWPPIPYPIGRNDGFICTWADFFLLGL